MDKNTASTRVSGRGFKIIKSKGEDSVTDVKTTNGASSSSMKMTGDSDPVSTQNQQMLLNNRFYNKSKNGALTLKRRNTTNSMGI